MHKKVASLVWFDCPRAIEFRKGAKKASQSLGSQSLLDNNIADADADGKAFRGHAHMMSAKISGFL